MNTLYTKDDAPTFGVTIEDQKDQTARRESISLKFEKTTRTKKDSFSSGSSRQTLDQSARSKQKKLDYLDD